MKILVTGSSGFLGKYVVAKLKELNYNVVEFDLPQHNLLTDNFDCLNDVDAVIHLAALKGIPACDANPEKAVEVNILGTTKLIDACYKKGIKKFLYISTWAVNSHNKKMYDVTKKATEEIVLHYIKRKKMNAMIIRLSTFYGGGMAKEGCINVFIEKAKQGLPAPIFGDGWEIRQFTHVKDIVDGLIIALEKAECREKPYIISCREVTNINGLGKRICGNVEHLPTNEEPENYDVLDASCIRRNGWVQKISLEQGITEMLGESNESDKQT